MACITVAMRLAAGAGNGGCGFGSGSGGGGHHCGGGLHDKLAVCCEAMGFSTAGRLSVVCSSTGTNRERDGVPRGRFGMGGMAACRLAVP